MKTEELKEEIEDLKQIDTNILTENDKGKKSLTRSMALIKSNLQAELKGRIEATQEAKDLFLQGKYGEQVIKGAKQEATQEIIENEIKFLENIDYIVLNRTEEGVDLALKINRKLEELKQKLKEKK